MNPINDVIEALQRAAFGDSHLRLDEEGIRRAIELDKALPTRDECAMLVMGDDNGEVPEELRRRFPNLNEFLEGYWA